MPLSILPYEILVKVVSFLSQADLVMLRQASRECYPIANMHLFHHIQLNGRKAFRPELDSKFGRLVRRLSIHSATSLTLRKLSLMATCHGLRELALSQAEVDEEILDSIVSNHRQLRSFKVCLGEPRHMSCDMSMWMMLDRLRSLETLHLFYVSHGVAEHLFYSLPCLKDFRVKLVSGDDTNELQVAAAVKRSFYNPHLTTLHVESWVKNMEIDRHLIMVRPECFPNLNTLELTAYQAPTNTWFQMKWPVMKHVSMDYVRCDDDGSLLAINCPNLESFRCVMWSASGLKLNSLLELPRLSELAIDSCLSQSSFAELEPAPRIVRLQMGIVKFSLDSLMRLGKNFPNVQYVQLGHCKSDQQVADAILAQELHLGWLSLATFQLNPVVAAIASHAPSLKSLSYEMPSKVCDAVKFKRMANLPASLKVLKHSD